MEKAIRRKKGEGRMMNLLKKILGEKIVMKIKSFENNYLKDYAHKTYSQDGEDVVLEVFLSNQGKGFYVDIGAHHPYRFSNTYLFYKKGWNGINVDALPGTMKLFNKKRKRDVNLELGVSKESKEMTYYMFNEPALNGFSKELSESRNNKGEYKIIEKKKISTKPLSKILDEYLPKGTKIDFINIDVEGMDLEVLESNDWGKYAPEYILIECRETSLEEMNNDPIYVFLKKKGYILIAKTFRTSIFKKD